MSVIDHDTAIYVGSGLFAALVFVVAIGFLVARTPLEPDRRTLLTFSVGFLAFVSVYFVSMAIYQAIGD